MAEASSGRTRRLVVGLLILTLVGGMAGTFFWVYRRGLAREGVLERAERLFRERDYAKSAELARRALAKGLDERAAQTAQELLVEALIQDGRHAEAKAFALELIAQGAGEHLRDELCRLALQSGDLVSAERQARALTDTNPDFSYRTLALISDLRGITGNDWRLRLDAAATLRGLASLADREAARGWALTSSSAIILEVLPFLPPAAGVKLLAARAREDLKAATAEVHRAHQDNHAYPFELSMAIIRVLSADEDEAALGAKTLRKFVSGVNRNERAAAILSIYYLRHREGPEAIDLIRGLVDSYYWNRVFWYLERSGQRDIALQILDSGPLADSPPRIMMRADLLLQSEAPEDKALGRKLLEKLVGDPASETPVVLRSLFILALRADLNTARQVAETAKLGEREDRRITALLAFLLGAKEEDKGRAIELARDLAAEVDTVRESREMLSLLGGRSDVLQTYLDTQIEKGGTSGLEHRLRRALNNLALRREANADSPQAEQLETKVRSDLKIILDDPEASKTALFNGFGIASMLAERELAGRLLGRAIALPGSPDGLAFRILNLLFASPDQEVVRKLAAGVRAIAPRTDSPAYVEAYADMMPLKGKTDLALLEKLEAAAGADPGSTLPGLILATRVALGLDEADRAEKHARAILAKEPDSAVGRELLGAVLGRRKAWQDLVRLHEGAQETTEFGRYQLAGALVKLGRRREALKVAKAALGAFPQSPLAYMTVADLYLERDEPRKALSILNIAPPIPRIVLMRAELLVRLKDYAMAEQLFNSVLNQTGHRNLQAWGGLHNVLDKMDRKQVFLDLTEQVLAGKELEEAGDVRATLRFLRGQALESKGQLRAALAEFEKSIAITDQAWAALNNAAWHIAKLAPKRIAKAREYIDKALKLAPNNAALLDTAAEVYFVQGEHADAFGKIDSAIALHPAGKTAEYTLHKARLLLRADRESDARALLDRVREKFPEEAAAEAAKEILFKLDLKNMPENEETGKTDGAGDGSG